MFNDYLKSFIRVAETGSITAASKNLYLSPTGLMKQLNHLENSLGFKLFIRSHKGLRLTPAGRSFYEDAKFLVRSAQESIDHARQIQNHNRFFLRIASSLMNQDPLFANLLQQLQSHDPRFHFSIMLFDDLHHGYLDVLNHLGRGTDLVASVIGMSNYSAEIGKTAVIGKTPLCVAMNVNNPLAKKEKLEMQDLQEKNIYVPWLGDSSICDQVRQDLKGQGLRINWHPTKTYDLSLFNKCANSNYLLLTPPQWVNAHPLLKAFSVNWPYQLGLGFTYSKQPTEGVKKFIHALSLINID